MKKSEKLTKHLYECPVEAFLKIVGQRWSSYILVVLLKNGELRFGKLKKFIPKITSKVLIEKLRELESSGLVIRDYQTTIPPKVSYKLTELGCSLSPFLALISEIAESWRKQGLI
jgi:DNA-binding HxlR family transcriptional regulator